MKDTLTINMEKSEYTLVGTVLQKPHIEEQTKESGEYLWHIL